MCIKDKKRLKMFGLALLGLCLYFFDTGSDTWVGNTLIQNCHYRFGAGVLCLVYVLPGLIVLLKTMMDPENQVDTCIVRFLYGLCGFVLFVPFSIWALLANLIKFNDDSIEDVKM